MKIETTTTNVPTKQEYTKVVIDYLVSEFGAMVEDGDDGKMDITIGNLQGQYPMYDGGVMMFDAMPVGEGFTQQERDLQILAVQLENDINSKISKLEDKIYV